MSEETNQIEEAQLRVAKQLSLEERYNAEFAQSLVRSYEDSSSSGYTEGTSTSQPGSSSTAP